MADINIEKKRKPVWPWIIGILAIIGIVWWAVQSTENPMLEGTAVTPSVPGVGIPSDADIMEEEPTMTRPERGFVSYIRNSDNRDKIGDDPEITGEALVKLSKALRDLTNESDLQAALDNIEKDGKQIKRDHGLMDNADKLSTAFTSAVGVMERMQQQEFPEAESEVNEVRDAAQQLNTDRDLFAQRTEVTSFFDEAAEAIQKMENSANRSN